MPDRQQAIERFLAEQGWPDADRSILADDASFRRYDRLRDGDRQAVLMDAPPPQEDTRPFIQIANHLRQLGLSAPEIYSQDTDQGLLILEDFGDQTYARVLARSPEREMALYELAVDVLIELHKKPLDAQTPNGLAAYDNAQHLREVGLLLDWHLPQVSANPLPPEAVVTYQALWQNLFDFVHTQPKALVLRDFHVDNLVWLENRPGLAACGLLDFQDALVGSRAYDLMSLLEDARRDISDQMIAALKQRYCAAFAELAKPGPAFDAFEASYAILGAGRHAKVIGIFTRLARRDAKPGYLVHNSRVWRLLERSLRHPMLGEIADWFDTYIPQNLRITPANKANKDK